MINKRIKILRSKFIQHQIDGYAIPKNDEFFSEYAVEDRLKIISNFSGSAGLAIILKEKNYLFIDGRYTIQAQQQSGKKFKIIEIHKFLPFKIIKNLKLGFDPSLFTRKQLNVYFNNLLIFLIFEFFFLSFNSFLISYPSWATNFILVFKILIKFKIFFIFILVIKKSIFFQVFFRKFVHKS